jgi:hypothetical protein
LRGVSRVSNDLYHTRILPIRREPRGIPHIREVHIGFGWKIRIYGDPKQTAIRGLIDHRGDVKKWSAKELSVLNYSHGAIFQSDKDTGVRSERDRRRYRNSLNDNLFDKTFTGGELRFRLGLIRRRRAYNESD